MTEEEALKRYCPLDTSPETSGKCIADQCMWWEAAYKGVGEEECGDCVVKEIKHILGDLDILVSIREG